MKSEQIRITKLSNKNKCKVKQGLYWKGLLQQGKGDYSNKENTLTIRSANVMQKGIFIYTER